MLGIRRSSESESIARNLRHAMSNYSRSTGAGDVAEEPGLLLIDSGVPYAVFNAALPTESFSGDLAAIRQCVSTAARHYGARGRPWSCWISDDLLAPEVRGRARTEFQRLGLEFIAEHTGMMAERIESPARLLPEMEMLRVDSKAARGDFIELASSVFHLPSGVARLIYDSERYWQSPVAGWVGYAGGTPVSTAVTDTFADVVGLYSVATAPGVRGRGYGECIARHALAEAQRSSGLIRSILQSTAAGFSLYRRMGYRPSSRLAVYIAT